MNQPFPSQRTLLPRIRQALIWLLVATVLGLVFLAYAHPQLMVDLADQIWACF